MSNPTTLPTYVPPNVTLRVVPDLPNGAELHWSPDGDVRLEVSSNGAFPGNMPTILRWAAGELERHLQPDASGYLVRRLSLVPPLSELIPAQRDGAE